MPYIMLVISIVMGHLICYFYFSGRKEKIRKGVGGNLIYYFVFMVKGKRNVKEAAKPRGLRISPFFDRYRKAVLQERT